MKPRTKSSSCSRGSATGSRRCATALLEQETLDQPEAYEVAGVPAVESEPDPDPTERGVRAG